MPMAPAKRRNIWVLFPKFENCAYFKKYLKYNECDSPQLVWKNAWIFDLGHNLFLKAHSFPTAMLSENYSEQLMWWTNIQAYFVPNAGGYCLCIHIQSDHTLVHYLSDVMQAWPSARALDLKCRGSGFKSFPLPLEGFVFSGPEFNFSTLCK